MPNLNRPFKFIICVLLTLFAHHPVADAQLVPYNNLRLFRYGLQTQDSSSPCFVYSYCLFENDMDWMGNDLNSQGPSWLEGMNFRAVNGNGFYIASRGTNHPSFGAGVLDALYLYDALASNGVFTPLPVHVSILDFDSPEHNREKFNKIFGSVVASNFNHAQFVSDVLLSPNTIEPQTPASYPHGMVGALPRELQIRRAASSGDPTGLVVSGAFADWNRTTNPYKWSLQVSPSLAMGSSVKKTAVLNNSPIPIVRLLAGKTVRMKYIPNEAGSNYCTWDIECFNSVSGREYKLVDLSKSRPANVVNFSGSMMQYSRVIIDSLLLAGADLSHYRCGGVAFQHLLDDLDKTILVNSSPNYPELMNGESFGCKNVVGAIGYHRYTATKTAQGAFEAIIAKSYPFMDPDFYGFGYMMKTPYPGNYAAMSYGRTFYDANPNHLFIEGNSYTAPLITGMLTLMRSIHPDFQGTSGASALQTLLLGSNKKAYVARITSESESSGKHPAELFVPIVTPVCMLLQGVIDKEIASAERIASAVGGNVVFNNLITTHGCKVAQL